MIIILHAVTPLHFIYFTTMRGKEGGREKKGEREREKKKKREKENERETERGQRREKRFQRHSSYIPRRNSGFDDRKLEINSHVATFGFDRRDSALHWDVIKN